MKDSLSGPQDGSGIEPAGIASDGTAGIAFSARAKRVIWLFINGGPSHVDTWDYKPELEKWDGKSIKEFAPEFENTTGFFKNAVEI